MLEPQKVSADADCQARCMHTAARLLHAAISPRLLQSGWACMSRCMTRSCFQALMLDFSDTLLLPQQVGAERYNLFTGCPKAKTATMVLRGGSEQFIDEAERSLHDAIMIVRRAMKNASVVPGGGAVDMEVSKYANRASLLYPVHAVSLQLVSWIRCYTKFLIQSRRLMSLSQCMHVCQKAACVHKLLYR